MTHQVCSVGGCGEIFPSHRSGKCVEHRRQHERERGSSTARGYDAKHQAIRAGIQSRMDKGERFNCWRCGSRINPNAWHLGHDDRDRSRYRGAECVPCNTATAGRR